MTAPPDASALTTPNGTFASLAPPPKLAKWRAKLTPDGFASFVPHEGGVPCWFHRQMQNLCFGIVWERTS